MHQRARSTTQVTPLDRGKTILAAAAGPVVVLLLLALALPPLAAAGAVEAGPPHHHSADLGCPSALFLRHLHSPAAAMGVEQIGSWAESSPIFAAYAPVLREQQLDAIALSLATVEELALVGRLPLGVALKLKRCFDELLENDLIDHPEDTSHDDQDAHEKTELDVFLRELPTAQEDWQRRRTQQQGGPADHAAAICNADINHNGEVDTADLLFVLGGFGGQCDAPAQPAGEDGGLCACSGELAEMIASLRRLQSRGAAPEPEPDATRPPRPTRPLQPAPAPQDASCVDMQTWVSSVDKVGCSQYGPGPTSWKPMCAAHVGYDLSEDGGQPGTIERFTPITAAVVALTYRMERYVLRYAHQYCSCTRRYVRLRGCT